MSKIATETFESVYGKEPTKNELQQFKANPPRRPYTGISMDIKKLRRRYPHPLNPMHQQNRYKAK